jgi:hypothetical protein
MITKAGVPSHKLTVGITSYGRQFKMTDPNCSNANCTYVGPQGAGTPGRCTAAPEYISNAEIKEIIQNNPSAKVIDAGDSSKVMTYDRNWVSYMDDKDKIARTNLWKGMNFGGIIDWAIDLNTFDFDEGGSITPGNSKNTQGMRSGGFHEKATVADTCRKDDSWKSVRCPAQGERDIAWADAETDGAWCAALSRWNSMPKRESDRFTDVVAQFLGNSQGFQCDSLVTGNGCSRFQTCAVAAASPLILRSMANINQVSDKPRKTDDTNQCQLAL